MQNFIKEIEKFNPKFNESLSDYTTWKIGGPAEVLVVVNNSKELVEVLEKTVKHKIEYFIIGGGSNTLIPDEGLKGLAIINKSKNIEILGKKPENIKRKDIEPRHKETENLDYENWEETGEKVLVKIDSGTNLPFAITQTLKQEITGLQWFAGIPGTVGGALFNNIHGGKKHFSDYFYSATIFTKKEGLKKVGYEFFEFDYDQSVLRKKQEITVVDITLELYRGNKEEAEKVMRKWLQNKKDQPRKTAGCVFKNITEEEQKDLNLPTNSTGYIIDKVLGLAGAQIGDAKISDKHANFILNTGNSTADDVKKLIEKIKKEAKQKLGLELETEIKII